MSDGPETPPRFPGYEIRGDLGRGGMGVVHRAWDIAGRREVALKHLHRDAADPLDRARFEREIRTLSALQHEGIVRLLEVGRSGAGVFYTMELVDGLPLKELLGRPAPDLEGIRWMARVAARALDALDHLHRAGLVHRDLKPANVLLLSSRPPGAERLPGREIAAALAADPDPAVKLVDFGLAAAAGAPAAGEERPAGTPLYMAPELADARAPLDARSDLYAIGVILYQAVTGKLPFERVGEALSRRRDPVPPDRLNPACPPPLAELILAQLDARPFRRAPSAAALRRDLLERAGAAAPPAPRVRSPAFCGRAEELARLVAALDGAAASSGRLALIGGGRGSGKTWLLERSGLKARAVLDRGFTCRCGRFEEGGAIHQGIETVLAAALRDLEAAAGREKVLEALRPWGASLLDTFPLDRPGDPLLDGLAAALGGAPAAEPGLRREQAIQTAIDLLVPAPGGGPRLLILEDLQHAEEIDLEIIARLAAAARDRPLAILATFRREPRGASPLLDRWIEEMRERSAGEPGIEVLQLGGLGDTEVEAMVRSMLDPAAVPGPDLVAAALAGTGGVPGAVEESIRDLWSRGAIVESGGRWTIDRAAAEVEETAEERRRSVRLLPALEALEEPLRLAIAAATVAGEPFDAAAIAPLLEESAEGEAARALRRLAQKGILEPGLQGSGYRFSAPALRRAAESLGDAAARRRMHGRMARRLVESQPDGAEEAWPAAARQFELAGEESRAVDQHLRFARRAASRGGYQRALASYRRALELMREPAERSRTYEELGKLLGRLGELDAALECLRAAAAGRAAADLLPVLEEEGRILQRRGDLAGAAGIFERCRRLAGGSPEWAPRILYRLGSVHFDRGDLAPALESFLESLESYRRTRDLDGMATVLLGLGLVEKRRGDLETASARIRESIACSEEAGRMDQVAASLNNLANLERQRGEHARAVECFRRSIEIRERLGDRLGIAICLNNLSRALGYRGEIRQGLEAALRSLEIFRGGGDRRGLLIASGNVGVFRFYQGELAAAAGIFRDNLQLARRLQDRRAAADALYSLGRLENSAGDAAAAERLLVEAIGALPEAGNPDLRASYFTELALARVRLGNIESAGDALEEGRECARGTSGRESAGWIRIVEAELRLERQEPEEAIEAAGEAVKLLEDGGSRFDAAIAHRQLARAYREAGPDWVDRTEKHFGIAERSFEEMGAALERGITLLEESRLWELLDEPEEAEHRCRAAADLFQQCSAPYRLAEAERALNKLQK